MGNLLVHVAMGVFRPVENTVPLQRGLRRVPALRLWLGAGFHGGLEGFC